MRFRRLVVPPMLPMVVVAVPLPPSFSSSIWCSSVPGTGDGSQSGTSRGVATNRCAVVFAVALDYSPCAAQ